MAISYQTILTECIYPLLEECRDELSRGDEIQLNETAPLYGGGGPLDSIELVRFILLLEEKVNQRFGTSIRLASTSAFIEGKSPFKDVHHLTNFVESMLMGKSEAS